MYENYDLGLKGICISDNKDKEKKKRNYRDFRNHLCNSKTILYVKGKAR